MGLQTLKTNHFKAHFMNIYIFKNMKKKQTNQANVLYSYIQYI